jgi:hypothetical protein
VNRGWALLGALAVSGGVAAVIAAVLGRPRNGEETPSSEGGILETLGLRRTGQDILDAVAAVDPEHNPQLQQGAPPASPDGTWCNKAAVWMVERLGVDLPWGSWGTRANDIIAYVDQGNDGWYPISEANAQVAAMQGKIVLATFYNFSGSGHLALVLPIPGPEVQIAQAGRDNFNQGNLSDGFGRLKVAFYAHD